MTWNEIVGQALFDSGLQYLGQASSADNTAAAYIRLNLLLSSFSRDGLLPPALTTITKTLVPGQNTYTAGPSGDLSLRPVEMDSVFVTDSILGALKRPVRIANWIEWNEIALPTVPSVPYLIAMNPNYPQAAISLYPTPQYNFTLSISGKFAYTAVSPLTQGTDEASLPEGFEETIIDVLAFRLAKSFRSLNAPDLQVLGQTASASYKKLLASLPYWNAVQPNPRTLMLSGRAGTINWNTGLPNRGGF